MLGRPILLPALGGQVVEHGNGIEVGVDLVAGSVPLPEPEPVIGGIPFGGQAARAAIVALALVALDRPDGPGDEARTVLDVVEPHHSSKSLQRFLPRCLVAGGGVFEGHRGEVVGGVAAIVIADLPQPAFRVAGPIELVDEAQAFESPLIHLTLEIGRLLQQRIGFVADDAQAGVGGNANGVAGRGNVMHVTARQPMIRPEVLEFIAHFADSPGASADPEVAVEPLG